MRQTRRRTRTTGSLLLSLCLSTVSWAGGKGAVEAQVMRFCQLIPEVESIRSGEVEELKALGEPAREVLLRLASGPARPERECAWRTLGREFRDQRLLPILRKAVDNRKENAEDRGMAALLLGDFNDAAALDGVLRLLDDDKTWSDAVGALGRMRDNRARDKLRDLMRQSIAKGKAEEPYRRGALLMAIGRQRDEDMIPLVLADLERSESTDINRYFACLTLIQIGTRASLSSMTEILKAIRDRYTKGDISRFGIGELTKLKAGTTDAETIALYDEVIAQLKPLLL